MTIARAAPCADVIVVLGCGLRDGAPTPSMIRRLDCGIALFRSHAAPLLLLSGGGRTAGAAGGSEAEAMRSYIQRRGIPESAILIEAGSRNTNENARESARLLKPRGLSRVILVSDDYHLPRAKLLFGTAGLVVVATRHHPHRGPALAWLREFVALPLSLWRLWRDRRGS